MRLPVILLYDVSGTMKHMLFDDAPALARVRRVRLAWFFGFLAVIGWGNAPASAQPGRGSGPPNIVFILADDLGWRDTGIYGSTYYETPSIDALAAQGRLFTNAYAASPLCSPTRASILTGQNPGRLRFTAPHGHLPEAILDPVVPDTAAPDKKVTIPQSRTRLPNEYVTYAEVLKEASYATAFVGKWHLGSAPYIPEKQGFDVVVGGRGHPGPPGGYFAPWPVETLPDVPEGTHISDAITDEAIRFVKDHRDEPFLLNLWFYDVHAPFQAREDLKAKYASLEDPQRLQDSQTMGAMIEVMDRNIGRVMDTLSELGLAENTIVIFTSDNGGNMYNEVDGGTTPTNNAPLRSGKGNIYEGGVRVPLIVRWPGVTYPGSVSQEVVSSVDYFPTLLDILDLPAPSGQVLDGVSLVPALKNEPFDQEAMYVHFPHLVPATGNWPATSVRQGDWKLIRRYCQGPDQEDRYELYDLRTDVGELRDVSNQEPQKTAELRDRVGGWLQETQALVPTCNPAYDFDAEPE